MKNLHHISQLISGWFRQAKSFFTIMKTQVLLEKLPHVDFCELSEKYMQNNLSLLAISILMLAGCATTSTNKNVGNKDYACFETEFVSSYNFYVKGVSRIEIKEVDGVESGDSKVCFATGEHKIGFTATTSNESANEYISYQFESAKKYKLSARKNSIAFICMLTDVTNANEVKLTEIKVKIPGAGNHSNSFLN